MNSDGILGIRI